MKSTLLASFLVVVIAIVSGCGEPPRPPPDGGPFASGNMPLAMAVDNIRKGSYDAVYYRVGEIVLVGKDGHPDRLACSTTTMGSQITHDIKTAINVAQQNGQTIKVVGN